MLTTLVLFSVILLLVGYDLWKNRDFLSPLMIVVVPFIVLFFIPAILKIYLQSPLIYVPHFRDHLVVIEYTIFYVFLLAFSFGISYLGALRISRNLKIPEFEIDFKNKHFFAAYLILAFGSFFTLMTLMPHNLGASEAYYHMAGFGLVHWLASLLLFNAPFLFLASPKHAWWSIPAAFCNFLIIAGLLGRGTATGFLVLSLLIVFRKLLRWGWKTQMVFFLAVPLIIIARKFVILYLNNPGSFFSSVTWFLIYELGRFDFLTGALFYKLEGLSIDSFYAARYVPFATYWPYIRDLNESFQALPEQLFLGSRISNLGGLPFTLIGELALMLNIGIIISISSFLGIAFGIIYGQVKMGKNPFWLGFYALFIYSGHNLGFSFLGCLVPVLIFLTCFCRVKIIGTEGR